MLVTAFMLVVLRGMPKSLTAALEEHVRIPTDVFPRNNEGLPLKI